MTSSDVNRCSASPRKLACERLADARHWMPVCWINAVANEKAWHCQAFSLVLLRATECYSCGLIPESRSRTSEVDRRCDRDTGACSRRSEEGYLSVDGPAGRSGSGLIKSSTRSTKFSTACPASAGSDGIFSGGRSASISSKSFSSIRIRANLGQVELHKGVKTC